MQDMQTITDLESRIMAALDRIGQGLDRLPAPPTPVADDATTTALQEALEAERAAHAQLAERLQTLKDREAKARADLEAQIAALTEARDQQSAELEGLRAERRAESAEMQAILSALAPLIEEPSHHA